MSYFYALLAGLAAGAVALVLLVGALFASIKFREKVAPHIPQRIKDWWWDTYYWRRDWADGFWFIVTIALILGATLVLAAFAAGAMELVLELLGAPFSVERVGILLGMSALVLCPPYFSRAMRTWISKKPLPSRAD